MKLRLVDFSLEVLPSGECLRFEPPPCDFSADGRSTGCSFNRDAPSDDASVSTSFGGASLIDASSGVVSTGTSLIGDNASEIWCCKSLLEEFSWFSSTALGVID